MAFISDILLILGAVLVAMYCGILSRRLKRLTNLEGEMGQVIRGLSSQIETLSLSVKAAHKTGEKSVSVLRSETQNAKMAARHLELLMASLHSLPPEVSKKPANPFNANRSLAEGIVE